MQAEVVVNRAGSRGGIFSYKVPKGDNLPQNLSAEELLGHRVLVPLGKKYLSGFIISVGEEQRSDLKEIKEISTISYFSHEMLETARFTAQHYLCSLYQAMEYMLPKMARDSAGESYLYIGTTERRLLLEEKSAALAEYISQKSHTMAQLKQKFGAEAEEILRLLLKEGLVSLNINAENSSQSREYLYESKISRDELDSEEIKKLVGRSQKRLELLRYVVLEEAVKGRQLRNYWSNYRILAKELAQNGLIEIKPLSQIDINYDHSVFADDREIALNAEQAQAVAVMGESLAQSKHDVFLLHGVTASGKTEVYLRLIKESLKSGRGVIMMVSEIALTPQLIGRLRSVLAEPIEVLHSSLADGERYRAWLRLKEGKSRVALGVRSAVFAPVKNLGLIILDEEHENTYKQSEPPPRYHAREVAIYRAELNQATVVLGSATPAVESYYKALQGEYKLLELKHRAQNQPLPEVKIVDLTEEFRQGNRSVFSRALQRAIKERIERNEQIILFLNRRGYASFVLCRECGNVITCPKCSLPLTYHKTQDVLKCHYCEQIMPSPKRCPQCGSGFIRYFGSGTELIESEIKKIVPQAKVLRLDLDSTQKADSHHQILAAFARGEAQILVGTQMVTKGLDFANVTLVGVLAADQTLNLPDYQASERTFDLLTQVSGRAGRGEKSGEVIVQTYNPKHYSILAAARQDYQYFYQKEIQSRKLLEYPPFSKLARLLFSDFAQSSAQKAAKEAEEYLREYYPQIELTMATLAPIEKIRQRWRYHLILKHDSLEIMLEALEKVKNELFSSRKSNTLRIIIDIEPQNIL